MIWDCEAAGGDRQILTLHMLEFWRKIKYSPEVEPKTDDLIEETENIQQQVGGAFTPKTKPIREGCNTAIQYGAVSIKWFPKKADHGEIKEFLVKFGVPPGHDQLNIKDNCQVIIENLEPEKCEHLCKSITGNQFKDKKIIYYQGIVLATPEKKHNDAHKETTSNPTNKAAANISSAGQTLQTVKP